MPTARWVAVFGVLVFGGALLLRRQEPPSGAVVHAEEPAGSLVVAVDAVRLDLRRVRLRLTPMRHEEVPIEHQGEAGADGRFHVTGLVDTDYRVELVAHDDPSLVLGRADFVRPRGEVFHLIADFLPATILHPGSD